MRSSSQSHSHYHILFFHRNAVQRSAAHIDQNGAAGSSLCPFNCMENNWPCMLLHQSLLAKGWWLAAPKIANLQALNARQCNTFRATFVQKCPRVGFQPLPCSPSKTLHVKRNLWKVNVLSNLFPVRQTVVRERAFKNTGKYFQLKEIWTIYCIYLSNY